MILRFIVYRGNGKQYLNERGSWTSKKGNAKLFESELAAWEATDVFLFGCGVEVVRISS